VCGRLWCGFVWSDCVLCVGEFGLNILGGSVCCVLESLVWFCGE